MLSRPNSSYEEIQHTADWAIRVWAETRESLFLTALKGMYDLIDVQLDLDNNQIHRNIRFQEPDDESYLVSFLSEALYLLETEKIVFVDGELSFLEDQLYAQLSGVSAENVGKEIKAVTYHQMEIKQIDDRFTVVIVFDV